MGDSTHFECPICLSEPLDPRCLKCGHLLCFDCLSKRSQDGPVACPLCMTAHDRTHEETPRVHAVAAYLGDLHPAFRVDAVTCQTHEKQVEFHCKSCDVQCCSLCFMMNHDGHPMESFIKQRFSQFQKILSSIDIQKVLQDLKKEELQLTNNVRQMTKKLSELRLKLNQVEICKAEYDEFLRIKEDIAQYQETNAVIALHDISCFIETSQLNSELHTHAQDMNFEVPPVKSEGAVPKLGPNIGTMADVETGVCDRRTNTLVEESSSAFTKHHKASLFSITMPPAPKMGIIKLRAKQARQFERNFCLKSKRIYLGDQLEFYVELKLEDNDEQFWYYIFYRGSIPIVFVRALVVLRNFEDESPVGHIGGNYVLDHTRECYIRSGRNWGCPLIKRRDIRQEKSPWIDEDGVMFLECVIELLD